MIRRYGKWAGCPTGWAENKSKCIVSISDGWRTKQCSRKRGHGPQGFYCSQHAKMLKEGRKLYVPKLEAARSRMINATD